MVRGCGGGLWTRSVPRIWRCAPEGATFLFWAPRALANRRRVGPARAGRNDKPRSSRFAHGPLPPPLSQVRSLVGERPNINPFCLTFAGEGLLSLRRRVGKCPLRTQRLRPLVLAAQWGTMGTPYAAVLQDVFSFLQRDRSEFRELQQLICRRCMKRIRDLGVNHTAITR